MRPGTTLSFSFPFLLSLPLPFLSYSRIKRCSDDGRAQMKFDLAMLQDALARAAPAEVRPLPKLTHADDYVRALVTLERAQDVTDWCREHPRYKVCCRGWRLDAACTQSG